MMLEELGGQGSELSILLTDDATIRSLNRVHRNKDKATDVLSFPQLEASDARLRKVRQLQGHQAVPESRQRKGRVASMLSRRLSGRRDAGRSFRTEQSLEGTPLGDVVISLDTAERQAKQRGQLLLGSVRFLLAHGLLHLFGYDHETDAEEAQMNALTRRLVRVAARIDLE
jgi:probable rRNA maturation factor